MPAHKRINILDVGQCGFDGPRMAELWQDQLNAHVTRVATLDEAEDALRDSVYDVVLVNRIFASDGTSGIEAIQSLKAEFPDAAVMLVSDLPEAQKKAVAAGALPGFGKQELEDPLTLEIVRKAAQGKNPSSKRSVRGA